MGLGFPVAGIESAFLLDSAVAATANVWGRVLGGVGLWAMSLFLRSLAVSSPGNRNPAFLAHASRSSLCTVSQLVLFR